MKNYVNAYRRKRYQRSSRNHGIDTVKYDNG